MSALTTEEAKWLKRLQKVLNECPSDRIGFFTVGDPSVFVYDCSKDEQIQEAHDRSSGEFCGAVHDLEADLGVLDFPSAVHSTAG